MSEIDRDRVFELRVRCDGENPPKLEDKSGRWSLLDWSVESAGDDPQVPGQNLIGGRILRITLWSAPYDLLAEIGDMRYLRDGSESEEETNKFFSILHRHGPPETDWVKGKHYHKGDYVRVKHPHKFRWRVHYCWKNHTWVDEHKACPNTGQGGNWIEVASIRMKSDLPRGLNDPTPAP